MPPRKAKAAPAKPLQDTTIVICGTFDRPNTLATLTERVKALGGDTHPTVTKAVTHVISPEYYYNANGAKVRPALGNEKVKIVGYDWLVEVEKKGEKVDEARFVFKALPANPVGGLDTLAATTAAIEGKANGKKRSAPADGEDKAPNKAAKADGECGVGGKVLTGRQEHSFGTHQGKGSREGQANPQGGCGCEDQGGAEAQGCTKAQSCAQGQSEGRVDQRPEHLVSLFAGATVTVPTLPRQPWRSFGGLWRCCGLCPLLHPA